MAESPRKHPCEDMGLLDWLAFALCVVVIAASLAAVIWAGKG